MTILLYGTDTYRLKDALRSQIAAVQTRGPVLFTDIDGTVADAADRIQASFASTGLFSEPRLVVINSPLAIDDVSTLLQDNPDDVTVVAVQSTEGLKAEQKRQLQTLIKRSDAQQFEPMEKRERDAWIASFCRERHRRISAPAAAELTRRTGPDTWLLANELEKLCAYSEDAIDEQMVRTLVAAPVEYDQWELSNALGSRDRRAALAALWRRLREGVPGQLLIGIVAAATRTMVVVKEGADRKLPAAAIAKASGLHPFVVSKTFRGVQSADAAALRTAHAELAQLDRDSKRGRADLVDGLFRIIMRLA